MVTIYNTALSATSQRHFSDSLGGGIYVINCGSSSLKDVALHSVRREVAA